MADPVSSVRIARPWTVSVGLGSPDILRIDVSRTVTDSFAVSAAVGFGPLGAMGSVNGHWHALRGPSHSLVLATGVSVAPGVAQMAGNGLYVGADANVGWEYRAPCGFTSRLSVGPAAYYGTERSEFMLAPKGTATLGWSF